MDIQFNDIDIKDIKAIAKEAGNAIMEIYNKNFKIEYKEDKSPLTEADYISNKVICSRLKELYPTIPLISEESKQIDYKIRRDWEYYWCIDPIDGTKEFIKKNGEFTINIALIHKGTPVLGVVYAPALNDIYYAKQNDGAFKNDKKLPLYINNNLDETISLITSKSHLSTETLAFIENLNVKNVEQVSKGSSLKFCLVAEGVVDMYPRLAPTMEWDTAAADAIVRESGKMTFQYDSNESLLYNKEELLNPWFIVKSV